MKHHRYDQTMSEEIQWRLGLHSADIFSVTKSLLTHSEKTPGDGRGSETGKHIICAGEMCAVWAGNSLTSTLTPHQHLTALCLSGRRVTSVTCSHFHQPEEKVTTVSPFHEKNNHHQEILARKVIK